MAKDSITGLSRTVYRWVCIDLCGAAEGERFRNGRTTKAVEIAAVSWVVRRPYLDTGVEHDHTLVAEREITTW